VHPEVLHWGFLHIRSYGVMLAVAFLVGTWIALADARARRLDEDKLIGVILAALIAGVIGARMLYVMEHLDEFRHAWGSLLALWQGGLTLYGGVIAGTAAALIVARRAGLPVWIVADTLTPSVALGTAFGRVGCFLNGCCYGRPTHLPWGVVYPPDTYPGLEFGATPIHPSQLYFSLDGLLLFALLWLVRKRFTVPGQLFWLFVALYALTRIPLDFTRAYEPTSVVTHLGNLDITESQVMSFVLALFAVLMMLRLKRRGSATPTAVVAATPPAPPPAPAHP